MRAAFLCGLAVLAQAAGARAQSPVFLACNIPARAAPGGPPAAPVERTFRVAPGSFQEWDAARHQFGRNLCLAFACVKTADRSEGSVGSASVTYTVGIVAATGEAYWRALGASDLGATQGPCRVVPAPTGSRP